MMHNEGAVKKKAARIKTCCHLGKQVSLEVSKTADSWPGSAGQLGDGEIRCDGLDGNAFAFCKQLTQREARSTAVECRRMQAAFCEINGCVTGARSDIKSGSRCSKPVDILLVTFEQWLGAKRGSQIGRGVLFVPA